MADEEKYPKPEPGEVTGVKYIYDSYFQESDNISHRTDWFLIFHAIFLEAFFAAKEHYKVQLDGCTLHVNWVQLIINVLGIVISFYWWMTGRRTWKILWKFGSYMRNEKVVGNNLADTHNFIYSQREVSKMKFYSWSKPSVVFLMIIPFLFMVAWVLIYFLYFDFSGTWIYMFGVAVVITLVNVYANVEDKRMKKLYGAKNGDPHKE